MKLHLTIPVFIASFIMACNPKPATDKSIHALTEEKIENQYGKPDTVVTYTLSDAEMYEYRANLQNIFRNYSNEPIEIREAIWKTSDKNTVVWFCKRNGQWIEVDNLTWNSDVKF